MQLTQSNYLQKRDAIDWSRIPAALTDKPKTVADKAAADNWRDMGEQTQKAVEQFFKLCNLLISKDPTLVMGTTASTSSSKQPQATPKERTTQAPKAPRRKAALKSESASSNRSDLITELPSSIPVPKDVPVIATHTAFIKRYLAMHGKVKTRDQIVSLVHGLQKAITEQRIGKDNPAAREIQKMQAELMALIDKMDDRAKIEIAEPYLSHYQQIAQGEEVRTSVKLLKQFIQMNGKSPDKAKAEKLGKKMAAAFDAIPTEDVYRTELSAGAKAVANYVNGSSKTVAIPEATLHGLSGLAGLGTLDGLGSFAHENAVIRMVRDSGVKDLSEVSLRRAFAKAKAPGMCLELAKLMIRNGTLNMAVVRSPSESVSATRHTELAGMDLDEGSNSTGIGEIELLDMRLANSSVHSLSGLGSLGQVNVRPATPRQPVNAQQHKGADKVSARDLAKLRFTTIGYNGRFKNVIGDPAIGFHMMVYGKPFQGKSSFVIELCKDLAALKKGRIAYLALEEGISASMQKKVIDRGADKVEGLDFLGSMPPTFSGYNFIVIDSVSDRSMKRDALRDLFLQNPDVCFICIFHATKEGSARGGLDYSHDMDIILKIEGHEPTVEKNRFL